MIDDLNLGFEDHDRGRGRRRRTERWDSGAENRRQDARQDQWQQQGGWAGSGAQPRDGYDPRYDSDPRYAPDPRYDTGTQGGYDPRYAQDPRYAPDPRYDTGNQGGYDPRYAQDPRYAPDPRYDTGTQRGYDPQYDEPRYEPDPRYDTGSRAYRKLDPNYDTNARRGGFLEEGYEDGGLLPGGGDYRDDDGGGGKRRTKKTKKKRRGRSFLALFLTLILLGALGGGVYLAYDKVAGYFLTPDYDGEGTAETVMIEVKQDQLLGDIANTLVAADVVKSYKAFVSAAEANPKAKNIQPGFYKLHKQMSGEAAVNALLDPKTRDVKGVTITEGMITIQIYEKLSKELGIPVADFQKAAANPKKFIPDWWFKRLDGKGVATGVGAIEGFLFPATYEFPPKATAEQVIKIMVDHFLKVTGDMGFADAAKALNISPYEALIAASIGQAEVVKAEDYPKVSRALYNRVYKDGFPCRCLQIDSAVNYWLRISGKVPKDSSQILAGEQHNPKDPYNTFDAPKFSGLPIGPISNPGELALKGAIHPAAGAWTFFVTIDKAGTMGYATTWAGHCKNIDVAIKNGLGLEKCS
ncbi:MAG: endolytic transglycosylase MltG [Hamadaea sp.]|uniref:endolytic transglycosylase MltG n=1 Tax=Hamadaea sp. TaxID=2024425 RepID=UPI0017B0C13D|nr:endolytic transglycosylase MltG [Hamadaea sp.]NUR73572.1 endolytic transglycosylase MltG [Hamadaea sp.]NUT18257.1 endolytic transglycosylase MltG [Hamadaea sp.]